MNASGDETTENLAVLHCLGTTNKAFSFSPFFYTFRSK